MKTTPRFTHLPESKSSKRTKLVLKLEALKQRAFQILQEDTEDVEAYILRAEGRKDELRFLEIEVKHLTLALDHLNES